MRSDPADKNDSPDSEILSWERRSAAALLAAGTYEERRRLYPEIYNEDNAYWLKKHGLTGISGQVARDHALLNRCFPGDGPVLDIGGGVGVAGNAFRERRSYVVCDASRTALRHGRDGAGASAPGFRILGYAMELPFQDAAFEGVLLLDVLEHLHGADMDLCLSEVRRVMRPAGKLLVSTPNRLSGPWDTRRDFPGTHDSPGLHLNELTISQTLRLLKRHGFVPLGFSCRPNRTKIFDNQPLGLWATLLELLIMLLPWRLRSRICPLSVVCAAAGPKEA